MNNDLNVDAINKIYDSKESLEAAIAIQTKIVEGNIKRLEMYKHLYKRYENE